MQKWHLGTAIGRRKLAAGSGVRGSECLCRTLSTFSHSQADKAPPAPTTLPKTVQRQQATVLDLRNLQASVERPPVRSTQGPSTGFRKLDLRNLAARPASANPNIQTIEAGRPRPSRVYGSRNPGDRATGGSRAGQSLRSGPRKQNIGGQGQGGQQSGPPRARRPPRGMRPDGKSKTKQGYVPSQAEMAYFKEKREEALRSKDFIPEDVNEDTLEGFGPRVIIGERGALEVVEDQLRWLAKEKQVLDNNRIHELANKLQRGELVYFHSDAEKDAVLAHAKELATERAAEISERKGEVVEPQEPGFQTLSEEARQKMEGKLLEGHYLPITQSPASPSDSKLQDIIRQVRKNATYQSHEEVSLVQKLGSIIDSSVPKKASSKTSRKKEKTAK